MAGELKQVGSITFTKGNVAAHVFNILLHGIDVAGSNYVHETMTVPTTAGGTTIPVGGLGSIGVYVIRNNDLTNYVDIMSVISTGLVIIHLPPGASCMGYFGSDVTAPAALAHTAPCQIEYMFVEQ